MQRSQRFRISYRDMAYVIVTASLLLPGIGVYREIFEEGLSVVGFPHIVAFSMYVIYFFWLIQTLKMKVEIADDTITVRTFWRTKEYSFESGADVLEVYVPVRTRGMTINTNYALRLRIEDGNKKDTIAPINIRRYDELKKALEENLGEPLRQEYIKASTAFKILDFFA